MTFDIHDIGQWIALACGVAALWWRMHQRDDRIKEARDEKNQLQAKVNKTADDLAVLQTRFEAHKAEDSAVTNGLRDLKDEIHALSERIARIETKLEYTSFNKE